jgi:hypothetical protein
MRVISVAMHQAMPRAVWYRVILATGERVLWRRARGAARIETFGKTTHIYSELTPLVGWTYRIDASRNLLTALPPPPKTR